MIDQEIEAIISRPNGNTQPLLIKDLFEIFRKIVQSKPLRRYEFSYNVDNYFISVFAPVEKKKELDASIFFAEEIPDMPKYFRGDDGLIYINKDGKDINVDVTSDLYKSLSTKKKCFGTGFENGNTIDEFGINRMYTCNDYLRDCLKGENIEQCKLYLKQPNFWNNSVKEVDDMLPEIALKTLKAFEFKKIKNYDTDLLEVQTVQEWITNLEKLAAEHPSKLSSDDVSAIKSNEKVRHYLGLLVNKINSSPAILNDDYKGPDKISVVTSPNYPILTRMGIPAWKNPEEGFRTTLIKLAETFKASEGQLKIRLGVGGYPNLLPLPNYTIQLVGGASNTMIDHWNTKVENEHKHTWHILQSTYLNLLDRIKKRYNKSITTADNIKITSLLDSLKKSETKLMTIILYLEKYIKLLELHGDKKKSVLSIDKLKELTDARFNLFNKTVKKRELILKALTNIVDAVSGQGQVTINDLGQMTVDKVSKREVVPWS
jgi:hypothetical protein